jgi:hypothetical protein
MEASLLMDGRTFPSSLVNIEDDEVVIGNDVTGIICA